MLLQRRAIFKLQIEQYFLCTSGGLELAMQPAALPARVLSRCFGVVYILSFNVQDFWLHPASSFQPMALKTAGNVLFGLGFRLKNCMRDTARSIVLQFHLQVQSERIFYLHSRKLQSWLCCVRPDCWHWAGSGEWTW